MYDEFLFAVNDVVSDSPAQTQTTETSTAVPSDAGTTATQSPSNASMTMQLLLPMVIVFAIMYFLTIRPQRKREKEIKEIQNSLTSGDWVVTFSGLYGKVVDVGDDILIVEFGTNKSVRIPIRKTEVTKSKEPSLITKEEPEETKK